MANKKIFKGAVSVSVKPDTVNKAGGTAYKMSDEHALAQYAVTGTFNDTFYSDAQTQTAEALELAQKVSPEYLAKVAVYAREKGYMKDMPAFLLAVLATRDSELFRKVFPRVIDNGKMLRNFVQIMRSGAVGRKSLGSRPKREIQRWLQQRKAHALFRDSVGESPSLADVIKMVHPFPRDKQQEALFAYLIGKKLTSAQTEALPPDVVKYEAFKKGELLGGELPNVDFRMLTSLPLTDYQWARIAKNAGWMMTRMNLNTFQRHGVFKDAAMTQLIAERLASKDEVQKARAFPYQLLAAYTNAEDVPAEVRNALQAAMEHSVENVPTYQGKVHVMIDVSGSMTTSVTGYRKGATSKVSCRDVAALMASVVLRKNPNAEVTVFDTSARKLSLNGYDSIMTNAKKISCPGGGTDCSAPVKLLNKNNEKGDLLIMVSDNMSWMHGDRGLQVEFDKFKQRNPKARLVCIDLLADSTTQAKSRKDTLNVGGFSDQVFDVINSFLESAGSETFWADKIKAEVTL